MGEAFAVVERPIFYCYRCGKISSCQIAVDKSFECYHLGRGAGYFLDATIFKRQIIYHLDFGQMQCLERRAFLKCRLESSDANFSQSRKFNTLEIRAIFKRPLKSTFAHIGDKIEFYRFQHWHIAAFPRKRRQSDLINRIIAVDFDNLATVDRGKKFRKSFGGEHRICDFERSSRHGSACASALARRSFNRVAEWAVARIGVGMVAAIAVCLALYDRANVFRYAGCHEMAVVTPVFA